MKRNAAMLSFIVALLFSLTCGARSVNLVKANPVGLFPFPSEPVMTPPTIIVHSPVENQACNSVNVLLNFTIIKPETWFVFNAAAKLENGQMRPAHDTFGNITSVYYIVDESERQDIPVSDVASLFDAPSTLTLNFSTIITLTAGAHTVKVSLEADSFYVVRYDYSPDPFSSVILHADSETVTFTVAENPSQEQNSATEAFPTTLVLASTASMAVVGLGLLVYFKKHREVQAENKDESLNQVL